MLYPIIACIIIVFLNTGSNSLVNAVTAVVQPDYSSFSYLVSLNATFQKPLLKGAVPCTSCMQC